MSRPTVVSLFAGGGGSSMGYKLAGYEARLAVEWDKHAAECYRTNFPATPLYHGDVAALTDAEALRLSGLAPGELWVLDGSPPCQGFSTAGNRDLTDGRNHLFLEYVRLLRAFRPRAFVMENVPGIALGKMKLVFLDVMAELRGAGYRVKAAVLDASAYGVPQRRRRAIFIGVREDLPGQPSFPPPTHERAVTVAEALGAERTWLLADLGAGGIPARADITMCKVGAYDPARGERVQRAVPVDVDVPAGTLHTTPGRMGDTLHGQTVVCAPLPPAAYDMVQLTGDDAGQVMPGGQPSPTVVRKGLSGAYKESLGTYAPPEGFMYFSSGMNADDPPIPIGENPSPTLMKGGIAGSACGQAQVAVRGASPAAGVIPAPPLTGKARAVAEQLAQGRRGSQARDGHWMQHVVRLDPAAPAFTVVKEGHLRDAGHSPTMTHPYELRGLSVGEVARLQSFPDDYRWPDGTTWASGWARVGNSVPPLMMGAIAGHVRGILTPAAEDAGEPAAEPPPRPADVIPAPPLKGKVLHLAAITPQGLRGADALGSDSCYSSHKLAWDRPARTITKTGGLFDRYPQVFHPDELRGLSVGEVARVQSFPDDYRWPDGTTWSQGWARVGNSVPPLMMRAVAGHVRGILEAP